MSNPREVLPNLLLARIGEAEMAGLTSLSVAQAARERAEWHRGMAERIRRHLTALEGL